ncbi:TlpA family protein disulfide reductase [Helicobacter sp. MIT 11-5569]|uniref:TlpA family protein disulfide reductase n=1 Tax=Helicobacter sp. MIT 11-5569 TaxID=1548151 RepID=UPI00051F9519|nr:TlpA disulfide reductase family protein [Helicobacter sp. MIT 11-5569]TLD82688.1 TlpA family protein disulfide reductase [Helicobacter sp. MIT 11-5569]
MKWIKFSVIFGLLCFGFLGCEKEKGQDGQIEQSIKEKKPEILENLILQSSDETTLIINQIPPKEQGNFKNIESKKENILKNLIVTTQQENLKILVFFTTWCDPCKGILPHLENLKKQFGEQISFYGIPIDDLVGEVENFKGIMQIFNEENATTMPLILDANRSKLFNALGGIEGVPLLALYDKDGHYIIHYLGAIPEEMIEFDLSHNLSKIKAH